MYLGKSLLENITETVLIVGALVYIGWIIKLTFEKD